MNRYIYFSWLMIFFDTFVFANDFSQDYVRVSEFRIEESVNGDILNIRTDGGFYHFKVNVCDSSRSSCYEVRSLQPQILLPPVSGPEIITEISVCGQGESPCSYYEFTHIKSHNRTSDEIRVLGMKADNNKRKYYHSRVMLNSLYYLLTRENSSSECTFDGLWHSLTLRGKRGIVSTLNPHVLAEAFLHVGLAPDPDQLNNFLSDHPLHSVGREEKLYNFFVADSSANVVTPAPDLPGFTDLDLGIMFSAGESEPEKEVSLGLTFGIPGSVPFGNPFGNSYKATSDAYKTAGSVIGNPFKGPTNAYKAVSAGKKAVKSVRQLQKTLKQKFAPLKSHAAKKSVPLFERLNGGKEAIDKINRLIREIPDESILHLKEIRDASARIKGRYDLTLAQYLKKISSQFKLLLREGTDLHDTAAELKKFLGDADFNRIKTEFVNLLSTEGGRLIKSLPEEVSVFLGDPATDGKKIPEIAVRFTVTDLENIGDISRGMERLRGLLLESTGAKKISDAPARLKEFYKNLELADLDHLKNRMSALDQLKKEMSFLGEKLGEMAQRHKDAPFISKLMKEWQKMGSFLADPETIRLRQNLSNIFTFVNSQNLQSAESIRAHTRTMMEKAGLVKSRFYDGWYGQVHSKLAKLEEADTVLSSRGIFPKGEIKLEMEQANAELKSLKNEIFTLHHLENFSAELPSGDLEKLRTTKKTYITEVMQKFRTSYEYIFNITGIHEVDDFKKKFNDLEKILGRVGLMDKKPVMKMSLINTKLEKFNQMMRRFTSGMSRQEWEEFSSRNKTLVQVLGFSQDQPLLEQTNQTLRKYQEAMNLWPPRTPDEKGKILSIVDELSSYKNPVNQEFWDKMYRVIANDPAQRGLIDKIVKWQLEAKTGISDGEALQRFMFGADPVSGKPSVLSKWLEKEQKVQEEILRLNRTGLADPDPALTRRMAYTELWPKEVKKAESRLSRLSGLFGAVLGTDTVSGFVGNRAASLGERFVGRFYQEFAPESLLKMKGMEDAVKAFAVGQIQNQVSVKVRDYGKVKFKAFLTEDNQQKPVVQPGSALEQEINFEETERIRLHASYDLIQSGYVNAGLGLYASHLISVLKYEAERSSGECDDINQSVQNIIAAEGVIRQAQDQEERLSPELSEILERQDKL